MIFGPRLRSSATERQVKNWLNFVPAASGGFPGVKSLQTGSIDLNGVTSNTATISAVVLANTMLIPCGDTHATTSTTSTEIMAYLQLTNTTTVTATRFTTEATAFVMQFIVVEFNTGVLNSVQRGITNVNGGTSTAVTITSVNTAKTFVSHLGRALNASGGSPQTRDTKLVLTNATTLTVSVASNPGVELDTSWEVVEFK